ncbi:hypothetical protein SRHO_G00222800 [Serrasalmus rhombeus]
MNVNDTRPVHNRPLRRSSKRPVPIGEVREVGEATEPQNDGALRGPEKTTLTPRQRLTPVRTTRSFGFKQLVTRTVLVSRTLAVGYCDNTNEVDVLGSTAHLETSQGASGSSEKFQQNFAHGLAARFSFFYMTRFVSWTAASDQRQLYRGGRGRGGGGGGGAEQRCSRLKRIKEADCSYTPTSLTDTPRLIIPTMVSSLPACDPRAFERCPDNGVNIKTKCLTEEELKQENKDEPQSQHEHTDQERRISTLSTGLCISVLR